MEYIAYDYEHKAHRYSFSYRELQEDYYRFKSYSNEEFLEHLPEILHFTAFVCHFKEIPTSSCLGDLGILHELIHLLNKLESPFVPLDKLRDIWNDVLRL